MWSFTYITEGGVIHNHYRGYGHSHIIYNTEGGVIHILQSVGSFNTLQRVGHSHIIQRVGSFTHITEGGVIHIHCRWCGHYRVWGHSVHCRGCGHSHTLQRVGSFTYNTEGGVIHISYKFCSDESGNVKIIL